MIGKIKSPAGWSIKRLKYVATYNDEQLAENTDDLREINYVEISDVTLARGIKQTHQMTFFEAPSRARRIVRDGDILISTVRTYLRSIVAVKEASANLIASTGFCVLRPLRGIDSDFLGWVIKSEPFISEVVARSVGVSYPAIKASDLVNIKIPIPDLDTQQRISQFLNEKTAHIDKLSELAHGFSEMTERTSEETEDLAKPNLYKTLVEYRSAVVTNAVTGESII